MGQRSTDKRAVRQRASDPFTMHKSRMALLD